MPYSPPGVVAPAPPHYLPHAHQHAHAQGHAHAHAHAAGRPAHRRSYTFAADDPRAGPGAFASLGALPRRSRSHLGEPASASPSSSAAASGSGSGANGEAPRRPNKFHFRGDVDNDDSSSSSDEPAPASSARRPEQNKDDEDDGPPPPLRLRQPGPPPLGLGSGLGFRLTPPTQYVKHGHGKRTSPPRSPQRSPNGSYTALDDALSAAGAGAANLSKLTVPGGGVPFPRAGSPASPRSPTSGAAPTRPPGPARTASTPVILLSNGKPLKSSLKSSSSAPHSLHHGHHLRARSAPSTPSLMSPGSSGATSPTSQDGIGEGWEHLEEGSEGVLSPGTPKAVHFPAPDSLEDVRVFRRGARPASVSFPLGDEETETETETDTGGVRWSGWAGGGSGRGSSSSSKRVDHGHGYPFPRVAVGNSPLAPPRRVVHQAKKWKYVLDAPEIGPQHAQRQAEAGRRGDMVLLEGVRLVGAGAEDSASTTGSSTSDGNTDLHLTGTLLARNAAFEKHVFVRFTLDGWCTTSEVAGRYVESLASIASAGSSAAAALNSSSSSSTSSVPGTQAGQGGEGEASQEEPGPGWDRFAFSIRLTDYAGSPSATHNGGVGKGLEGRELVLVARFFAPWVGSGGVGPYVWCGECFSSIFLYSPPPCLAYFVLYALHLSAFRARSALPNKR
ncbi:hypothetical protein B0H16DRAFT_267110 [Mycena metata]|uniref:CBM21 domain-containing protein n=1 Tax=Mycena metata TaxID=1033252 RepID=A0AAD7HR53_9AGAR|nr:hypothetical protein B0H16DRAFT_267110 [Mycena metata]